MADEPAPKVTGNREARAASHTKSPPTPQTVLVVEDERSLRELVVEVLRQQGYAVLQAPNGKAALKLSLEYPGSIDLLVTDLVMPQMNGVELVRETERHRHGIKVLYVSGHWESALARMGFSITGSTFLEKPFALGKLVSTVRDLLNTSQDARQESLLGQRASEEKVEPNSTA